MKSVSMVMGAAVVAAGLAGTANAELGAVFNLVPGAPSGWVSQDLIVETTTDWTGSNLIVTLTDGTIFQKTLFDSPFTLSAPTAGQIAFDPELAWDTRVNAPGGAAASSAGGAVDLGGTPAGAFDESQIDINWFTTATNDIGTLTLGRITLSTDAQGTWKLRTDAVGQAPVLISGFVEDGVMLIPEPASLALLGIGGLALLRRRTA